MPYISDKNKKELLDIIIKATSKIEKKGELNYFICELVGGLILKSGLSYTHISEWISAVHDAEAELTRRVLVPYEDTKKIEGGDVFTFIDIEKSIKK